MKPGLTGMWQVSGRSDITDFEEVVKLDMDYIQKWNIGMDIKYHEELKSLKESMRPVYFYHITSGC